MQFEKVNSETMPWRLPGGEGRTILQNGQAFFLRGLEIKPILLPRLGGWRQIEKLRAECAGSGGRGLLGSEKSSTPAQRRVICRVAGWRYLPELGTETYSRSDRKIQTPNTNDIKDGRSFRTRVKKGNISPTCKSKRWHPLELWLLEPFPHSSECFSARLELRPGLWVAEQIRERALTAAQHSLCEDGLRDWVPLEFCRDTLGKFFCVDLFYLTIRWCCRVWRLERGCVKIGMMR